MSVSRDNTVSVIVPFFNTREDFIREAVASILSQDYQAIEVLLVDDGSTEAAASVARAIADGSQGRVRYISQPDGQNKGASAARNLGVSQSTGEYIAFLDADDIWYPEKLTEQVTLLESMPDVAMVFGLSEYWYDWKGNSPHAPAAFVPKVGASKERVLSPPEFVVEFLRGRIVVPNPSNFMVRRKPYVACGGFESRFTGMYDDQVFYAKLGLRYKTCVVPRRWDRYRQHPDSLTAMARVSDDETRHRRRFLAWLGEHCRVNDIDAPEVWEAIAKALWLCPNADQGSIIRLVKVATWFKKRLLHLEERVVPRKIRWRWWLRRELAEQVKQER